MISERSVIVNKAMKKEVIVEVFFCFSRRLIASGLRVACRDIVSAFLYLLCGISAELSIWLHDYFLTNYV